MKLIPEKGDKVFLKSEEELLKLSRTLLWYMTDSNRIQIAKSYGNKIVICNGTEIKYNYFFTKEGPTLHFDMINIKRTVNEINV